MLHYIQAPKSMPTRHASKSSKKGLLALTSLPPRSKRPWASLIKAWNCCPFTFCDGCNCCNSWNDWNCRKGCNDCPSNCCLLGRLHLGLLTGVGCLPPCACCWLPRQVANCLGIWRVVTNGYTQLLFGSWKRTLYHSLSLFVSNIKLLIFFNYLT